MPELPEVETVRRGLEPAMVDERFEAVEQRLYEATSSQDPFLTRIAQHLLGAGGKRYRPLLAQVAAELGGGDGDGPVEAGVAVELIHLGSLYHDDVIDEAESRRGAASVNAMRTTHIAMAGQGTVSIRGVPRSSSRTAARTRTT